MVKFYVPKYNIYKMSNSTLYDTPIEIEVNANSYDFYKTLFENILDVSHSPYATRIFHSWFQHLIFKFSEEKKRDNSLNCALYSLITITSHIKRNDSQIDSYQETLLNLLKDALIKFFHSSSNNQLFLPILDLNHSL